MTTWIGREAASQILLVSTSQVVSFVADGFLTGSGEQVSLESVRGLARLLLELEAGLLGLTHYTAPPDWITPSMAAAWIGVPPKRVAAMVKAGEIRSAAWQELSGDDVLEVLFAVEATAPGGRLPRAQARGVDALEAKLRQLGKPIDRDDLRAAAELAGTRFLCSASSVRRVARRRARFNPPARSSR